MATINDYQVQGDPPEPVTDKDERILDITVLSVHAGMIYRHMTIM
jgi:hypothetical protein